MSRVVVFVCLLMYGFSGYCDSFFWKGGSGSWGDLSCWKKTSGGTESWERLPSSGDAVFFTIVDGGTVTVGSVDTVSSLDVSGNHYTFSGGGELWVRGSVQLNPDTKVDIPLAIQLSGGDNVAFRSSNVALRKISFEGLGSVSLLTDLSASLVVIRQNVKFQSNSKNLSFVNIELWPGATADFASSLLKCEAGNITLQGTMVGRDFRVLLNRGALSCTSPMQSLLLTGDCSASLPVETDSLVLKPGARFNITSDSVIVHECLNAVGTEDSLVFIGSWYSQERPELKCHGSVDVDYVIMRNLYNRSIDILNASHAVDMGNNLRWNFSLLVGKDYHWNKASGNWDDLSSWPGHKRLPTAADNVYIDSDAVISVQNEKFNACHNLVQRAGTELRLLSTIDVYGNVDFKGRGEAFYVNIYSDEIQTFKMTEDFQIVGGLEMKFVLNPSGVQHTRFDLLSDVKTPLMFVSGALLTNGKRVDAMSIFWYKADDMSVFDIAGSDVICKQIWFDCDDIRSVGTRITAIGGVYNRMLYTDADVSNMVYPARDFQDDKAEVHIEGDTVNYVVMKDRGVIRSLNASKLELSPDCDVSLMNDISVKQLVMVGKRDSLIKLSGAGGRKYLKLYGGNQQAHYSLVDRIDVLGNRIQTQSSYFFNPCQGWDVTPLSPQTFYWVGGSGRWSNLAHWSASSGGSASQTRVPFPCDAVIIDAGSGMNASDLLTIDLINCAAGDLQVNVPCQFGMSERGRKLNVGGDFVLADGVNGQLYELWLWGKAGMVSNATFRGALNVDMVFQMDGDYVVDGNMKAILLGVYGGKDEFKDAVLDLISFRGMTDKKMTMGGCTVDVADWWVGMNFNFEAANTLISVYRRSVTLPAVNKYTGTFFLLPGSVCDRMRFYGTTTTSGLKGSSLYVAPYSDINFSSGQVVFDSVMMLGGVERYTRVSYANVTANSYTYLNGLSLTGVAWNAECSAWHSEVRGETTNIRIEDKPAYTSMGVQLVEGEHVCNDDMVEVKSFAVPPDRFRWYRNDTLIGQENCSTVSINKGGRYYCDIVGKLDVAKTNEFYVIHEHDFKAPAVLAAGDTIRCVTDPVFDTKLTAVNIDDQQCRGYKWFLNDSLLSDGAAPDWQAIKAGYYTAEVYGWACKSGVSRKMALLLADDVPDADLMVPHAIARHCPGDTIEIGIDKIAQGSIPVYYYWTMDGALLAMKENVMSVVEDGHYAVTLGNVCGLARRWTDLYVKALIPPTAPIQEADVNRCGPGDLEVGVVGTNGYRVRWYDEAQELLGEGMNTHFVYADRQKSERVYADVVDFDGCVSEKGELELVVFEVAVLNIGDFSVPYKDSIWLEPIDLPINGTFTWTPCDEKLSGCSSRVPLFRSGLDFINKYTLEYMSPDGCPSVDSTTIEMTILYKFPAVFTPNGDGHNDTWEVYGLELCPGNRLFIYDRNGKQIYKAAPYTDSWDGQSDKGEQLPPGTYVFQFTPDGRLKLGGMVSIIRN